MLRSFGVFVVAVFCFSGVYSQTTGVFSGFITSSDNENVYLRWNTIDSSDAQYFTVEKSKNGVQWITLDTVSWNSDSHLYLYIDTLPATGLNYYRIKAASDGRTVYSISRRAYVGIVQNLVTVYPNPVIKNVSFEMSALIKGRYRAVVFTPSGIKIAEKVIDHDGMDKNITIPLPPTISRGIYWIVLMTKNEFYKQNFLVQ